MRAIALAALLVGLTPAPIAAAGEPPVPAAREVTLDPTRLTLPAGVRAGQVEPSGADFREFRVPLFQRGGGLVAEIRFAVFPEGDRVGPDRWLSATRRGIAGRVRGATGPFGERAFHTEAGTLAGGAWRGIAWTARTFAADVTGDALSLAAGLPDALSIARQQGAAPRVDGIDRLPDDGRRGIALAVRTSGDPVRVEFEADGGHVVRTALGPRLYPRGGGVVTVRATAVGAGGSLVTTEFVIEP